MNTSKCPHCQAKLGHYYYADECPFCHEELKHNTQVLTSTPGQKRQARSWPIRLVMRVARFIES